MRVALPGVMALAVCLVACGTRPPDSSSASRPVKLTVCINSAGVGSLPPAFALEKGLFSKYGLDVTLTQIASGARSAEALISGSAQICQLAAPAVVNAVIAGADLAIVGGLININPYVLMVPASIRSPEDLKGKSVAVSAPGSSSAISMRLAARRLGLDPDRDVTMLSMGTGPERIAALEAGTVVGTLADPPEALVNREHGYHALVDLSQT